jgi:hypothetical protein
MDSRQYTAARHIVALALRNLTDKEVLGQFEK